ncbi:MAG: hypothetical protein HY282_09040 [Nitrospirae bacterium]|nr:hypothetical protein [Candidatus Manganitrophaceae bacterium]
MKRLLAVASASLMLSLGLTACGGGGGSSPAASGGGGGGLQATGFQVPTEISAVPTNLSGVAGGVTKPGLRSKLMALKRAATDAGTDYSNAQTTKFVEEHALDQFSIVEEIMKSLAQTHYADATNLGHGPYKAMVTQPGNDKGSASKVLQPWIVDSKMITENGKEVNVVQVWIEETDDSGQPKPIKAQFKISASATKRSDGSYQDYGVWNLNAGLGGSDSFTADASVGANGEAVLKIHEISSEHGGGGTTTETKGVLNKSDGSGFGKVVFPDFSNCNSPSCVPTATEAKYVYDAHHLAVQAGSNAVEFKDRDNVTDMTHQYGMYESDTGKDVLKTHSFGFPVQYTDTNGVRQFAYYGAWQGRHQLWANGGTVPEGTVVTRQDRGSNQTAETYTVSQAFLGTLVKRTLVAADINDLVNIPVETWVNFNYNLLYNGSNWVDCPPGGMIFNFQSPATCPTGTVVTDFAFLEDNPLDTRKFININKFSGQGQPTQYIRLAAGDSRATSGAGFYQVTMGAPGTPPTIGAKWTNPTSGDQLNANVGGSIYIAYNGTHWVQKKLLSFDQSTWTPTFADPTADTDYTLDPTREYYINNQGINYVVKVNQADPSGYTTKIELQSVANPVNAASFVPAGTTFKQQWDNNGNASTFSFDTNSAHTTTFLKLVYATVSTTDQTAGINVGDIVTQGQWGLVAYDSQNANTGIQFNWDYPSNGQAGGTLTYLIDGNSTYKLLDDPIRLAPITLTNHHGDSKTFSLQFDGWMGGLPDLYQELQKNDFVMTSTISDKVVNIPAGTEVVDASDATKHYLIKPLETSQFLNTISDPLNLDLTDANNLDLSTVPTFVDPGLGAEPQVTGVKYSEGVLVE